MRMRSNLEKTILLKNMVCGEEMEGNLTKGPILKTLTKLAIPIMASSFLGTLYNLTDMAWIGLLGSKAVAGVGVGGMYTWLSQGLASMARMGGQVQVAQCIGKGNRDEANKYAQTAVQLATLMGLVYAVIVLLFLHQLIGFFQLDDAEAIAAALSYTRIACGLIVFSFLTFTLTGIYTAQGDSRTPFIANLIGLVINMILDPVLILGPGPLPELGVAGAAIATVIAQSFSAVYCFLILRRIDIVHLSRADFMTAAGMNARLMKLGIPVVFQNIIIGVGGLVVQYVINGYGFLFVAGFTATNKLYGLLEMAAISYGYAIVTYVGQNLGARRIDRIRKGVRSSMLLSLLTSLIISAAMFLFGKNILSLFISGEPQQTQEVLAIAFKYLSIMAAMLWVLYFLYVYRSALQGLGDTLMPMVSGMAEFVMRISAALILPHFIGQDGIFFAEIAAWSGATVILCISYYARMHKYH